MNVSITFRVVGACLFWGIVASLGLIGCGGVGAVPSEDGAVVREAVPSAENHPALAEKPVEPLAVKVEEGVAFTSPLASGFTQRLDVYAPEQGANWPAVVLLHGSGEGKSTHADWATEIAAQGAVVFVADWPVGTTGSLARNNGNRLRNGTEVVLCAVRFARSHGDGSERVVLAGFSAGAAIGSLVSFGGDELADLWVEYEGLNEKSKAQSACLFEGKGQPDGFVGIGGGYRLGEAFAQHDGDLGRLFDPYKLLNSEMGLPVRLVHGVSDTVVRPKQSQDLHAALLEAGYDVEIALIEGKGHTTMNAETVPVIIELAYGK